MLFSDYANHLENIEKTTKRLEITGILTELIKELTSEETDKAIYLSLGYLRAPYETQIFGMADKMVMTALEQTFGVKRPTIEGVYKKEGDLGDVAYTLAVNSHNGILSITEVYDKLLEIAKSTGSGSQERKIAKLAELLKHLGDVSSKYVIRMVLGTTRLGFTELTVIDALSNFLAGDKSLKSSIESKHNARPDVAYIAKKIKQYGAKGIEKIDIELGIPIRPQLAQRAADTNEILERMTETWVEYKFDGTRVQLHMDKNRPAQEPLEQQPLLENGVPDFFVKTYTRNLNETTHQFPDIIEAAKTQINAESVILDGEAIGYDKITGRFLPLQETIQRKRKHDVLELSKQIPLKYVVFDLIYHNGKSLINTPLAERRKFLDDIIKPGSVLEIAPHILTKDEKELAHFFKKAKSESFEGIVAKNPASGYEAGARAYSWIKLKREESENLDDTVDCVVLGYYFGKGARAVFGIGGFLVGVYDSKEDVFKTVSKIGTGLKDDEWVYLRKECNKIKVKQPPKNVVVAKALYPNVWTQPKIVVAARADEITTSSVHTAGHALRNPRLMAFRTDKAARDATTLDELNKLYKLQKHVVPLDHA